MNYTTFTKSDYEAFKADNRPGAIHMLNLIRLRSKAEYSDERQATGAEAYAEYSRVSAPVFSSLGGSIAWRGDFELMMIGPVEEHWDICFVAEYPSVSAFLEMLRDPIYREAMTHRQAAIEDSRLIRFAPSPKGSSFAGSGISD